MSQVYFLRPVGFDGPIKIGYTGNLALRMQTFAMWSPFPLEIVVAADGGQALENRLHEAFDADRLHFEWFRLTPRLASLMQQLRETGDLKATLTYFGIPLVSPYFRSSAPSAYPRSADAFISAANTGGPAPTQGEAA